MGDVYLFFILSGSLPFFVGIKGRCPEAKRGQTFPGPPLAIREGMSSPVALSPQETGGSELLLPVKTIRGSWAG